jgi:hypothetical protein
LPLPFPLNKTTYLEVLIGFTQLYAFASVSKSGLSLMIMKGFLKLRMAQKLLNSAKEKKGDPVNDLLVQRLEKEVAAGKRNIFVGANVLCIGIAFFWLFANSFHVTETDWIGGLPALIHALIAMEVALLPLLYFMVADAVRLIGQAAVMEYLVEILRKCDDKVPQVFFTDEIFALTREEGWEPFWERKSTLFSEKVVEDEISLELEHLAIELDRWTNAKSNRKLKEMITSTTLRIELEARKIRLEGYREFLYFMINFVAFYGYMLGILVYYKDKEDNQSLYVRSLKLGMTNADADWNGNFAGDLMWTLGKLVFPITINASGEADFFFLRANYHSWKSCFPKLDVSKAVKIENRLRMLIFTKNKCGTEIHRDFLWCHTRITNVAFYILINIKC